MLRKLLFFGLLAAALAFGIFFFVRLERRESREADVSANKKPADVSQGGAEEDEVKTPPPEPPPKVTVLSAEARVHLAEKAFISGLRTAFLWRGGQPQTTEMRGEWLEKLTAIPSDELSVERRAAWSSLLEAWRALSDLKSASDPQVREKGNQAAAVLNAMLKEHGDGDIQF